MYNLSEFKHIHNCAIEKQWIAIFNCNPKMNMRNELYRLQKNNNGTRKKDHSDRKLYLGTIEYRRLIHVIPGVQ